MHHILQYHIMIAVTCENYILNGRPEISVYLTMAYFKYLYLYLQQIVSVCKD